MKCPQCGAFIARGKNECEYCGWWKQQEAPAEKPAIVYVERQAPPVVHERVVYVERPAATATRRRGVALLLCFLLGWVGAHRFYLGKIGTGILYLLTGGFMGIGVAVDFLSLLLGHPHDKQGLPVHW